MKLSNGADVAIDADEVNKLMLGVSRGSVIRFRQGIVNPSFVVAVVPDKERIRTFMDDTKYQDENTQAKRLRGLEPLRDIFEDVLPLGGVEKRAELSAAARIDLQMHAPSFLTENRSTGQN